MSELTIPAPVSAAWDTYLAAQDHEWRLYRYALRRKSRPGATPCRFSEPAYLEYCCACAGALQAWIGSVRAYRGAPAPAERGVLSGA